MLSSESVHRLIRSLVFRRLSPRPERFDWRHCSYGTCNLVIGKVDYTDDFGIDEPVFQMTVRKKSPPLLNSLLSTVPSCGFHTHPVFRVPAATTCGSSGTRLRASP